MSENILEVSKLCKTYDSKGAENTVLTDIDITIGSGEFVAIMGPSGSGKSTFLYTVSGMDKMTSGKVLFDGEELSSMDEKQLTKLRLEKMGFIFQQMYMMKKLNIFDNIVLPAYQAGRKSRADINKHAEKLMENLGISEIAKRPITDVSGGQLQRACLCRALINEPKVIFADEPTGALNSRSANEVMNELVKANQNGTGIVMVTHSEKVASMSSRIIYLVDGSVKGQLVLGSCTSDAEMGERTRRVKDWLNEMGW